MEFEEAKLPESDGGILSITRWIPRTLFLIIAAGISTVMTLGGTWAYDRFTSQKTEISYDVESTPKLIGALADTKLFIVDVANTGGKSVKEVQIGVSFDAGVIGDFDLDGPVALVNSVEVSKHEQDVVLAVAQMNVNDVLRMSMLVDGVKERLEFDIDVRGQGVVGKERVDKPSSDEFSSAQTVVVGTLTALTALLAGGSVLRLRRRGLGYLLQRTTFSSHDITEEPREVVLADFAFKNGAVDLGREYLRRAGVKRWWLEADYVTSLALIKENDSDVKLPIETAIVLLKDLSTVNNMAASSRACVYYNIARLYKEQGDLEQAQRALEEGMMIDEEAIKQRLDASPSLNEIMK